MKIEANRPKGEVVQSGAKKWSGRQVGTAALVLLKSKSEEE